MDIITYSTLQMMNISLKKTSSRLAFITGLEKGEKMKVQMMMILLSLFTETAHSAVVCKGQSNLGKLTATISDGINKAVDVLIEVRTNEGRRILLQEFRAQNVTDGHANQIHIAAPGLRFSYSNDYGCIRRAAITAKTQIGFIDTVSFPSCRGGGTPAQICHE